MREGFAAFIESNDVNEADDKTRRMSRVYSMIDSGVSLSGASKFTLGHLSKLPLKQIFLGALFEAMKLLDRSMDIYLVPSDSPAFWLSRPHLGFSFSMDSFCAAI